MNHTTTILGKAFKRSKSSLLVLSALGMLAPSLSYAAEEAAVEDIEVIEVTGLRSSIIASQARKLDSDKIMDGITSEDMSALPDNSVTETLQRVSGVTIDRYMSQGDPEHFSVEGNGVAVRGLTEVSSQMNGRSTFSATGGRTLSFGDVPPELMSGVMVYKSPTADQIEGGLGGTIDLETRTPFQMDGQHFAFDVSANYGDLGEETTPSYSALYSNTWDTDIGRIGFLADFAFSELKTRNDSMYVRPFFTRTDIAGHEGEEVYVPRGADWRTMHFDREREGQYIALQWEPSDNQELTFTYFNSKYDMTWDEDAIFVSNDPLAIVASADSVFGEDGVLQSGRLSQSWGDGITMGSDVRVSTQAAQTEDFSLAYTYYNDDIEFSASAQYVTSSSSGFDSTVATDVAVPYIDVDFTGSLPSISAEDDYLQDVNNYRWSFMMDQQYQREADMLALQADTKFYLDNDIFTGIKVGVRYTDTTSDNADTEYNWSALAPTWLGLVSGDPTPSQSDVNLNTFSNFFGGDAADPASVYAPVVGYALNYPDSYNELQNKFTYNEWDSWAIWSQRSLDDDQWKNNQSEETLAVYAMVDFEFEDLAFPISGNFGVRYVETDNEAHGFLTYPANEFFGGYINSEGNLVGSYTPTDATNSYSNVLPSINVKMELADNLLLRFAAAIAIARPDYSQLASNQSLNATVYDSWTTANEEWVADTVNNPEGTDLVKTPSDFYLTSDSDKNPYLEPMESTQFDLSLEWYYDEGNSAYLALFTKDIDGYEAKEEVIETYGADGFTEYDYKVTRPVNNGSADLKGVELSINHFFTSLPAPFNGFGVSANYTYIDSSTDTAPSTLPVDTDGNTDYGTMPYFGISKNSYNIVGMYEKDAVHVRVAYNWRSKYLTSIGANGYNGSNAGVDWKLPVYNEAAGFLDASFVYDINDNFTVALEATNILNEVSRNIMGQIASGDHYSAYHYSDTRYGLSLRGKF
ncbi:MAG: TonB-dependent receptor [Colwellia sp.]